MNRVCERLRASDGWFSAVLVATMLAACGGGQELSESLNAQPKSSADAATATGTETNSPPSTQTIALQEQGARLNAQELEQVAQTGVLPAPFEGPLLSGAEGSTAATLNPPAASKSLGEQKSAASRVPAYRFFNTQTGAHFYTTSETERNTVQATLPQYNYEGPAFHVSSTTVPGLSPVHRFFNTLTGVHFYTISENERANVATNLPQFTYEGIAYYASTLSGTGYTPLYRFFYASRGFHFYTNTQSERDNIIANLPQYSYEGIGYYVLGDDWQTPAISHSGVKSDQCYAGGSDNLFDCALKAVKVFFNGDQDGHRTHISPMSYSLVKVSSTVSFPATSCVRDDVTGLIWEGKTDDDGMRDKDNTYTNLGNSAANDASAYVAAVNANELCGFGDWRLPSVSELQGIADFGVTGGGPKIAISQFPNTRADRYWTSDAYLGADSRFWIFNFEFASAFDRSRSESHFVRLVRGAQWTGARYLIGTEIYPGDAANNVAIDRKTGLIWRRCEEGRVWNGSTCAGSEGLRPHELALSDAASKNGWRLPNAKELGSLVDRSRFNPALDTAFLSVISGSETWSSSPAVNLPGSAIEIDFYDGYVSSSSRNVLTARRLVRSP